MATNLSAAQVQAIKKKVKLYPGMGSRTPIDTLNSQQPNNLTVQGRPWQFYVDKQDALISTSIRAVATVSTGGTPGTPSPRPRMPVEGLGTLSVKVNGAEEFQLLADLAYCIEQWYAGRNEVLEITSLTAAQLATGSATLSAIIDLPLSFCMKGAWAYEEAGLIPTYRNIDNILIQSSNLGAVATIMDSPGATQAISAWSIVPTNRTIVAADANPMGYGAYYRKQRNKLVAGTGLDSQRIFAEGGMTLVGLAILTQGGSTTRAQDAVLTNGQLMTVKVNTLPYKQAYPEKLAAITANMMPATFDRSGFYMWDFCLKPDGTRNTSNAIKVPPGQELIVEYNTTTTTNGNVFIVPIIATSIRVVAGNRGIR